MHNFKYKIIKIKNIKNNLSFHICHNFYTLLEFL